VRAVFVFVFKCWHREIRNICNGGFHSDRGKPLLDAFTFVGSSVQLSLEINTNWNIVT